MSLTFDRMSILTPKLFLGSIMHLTFLSCHTYTPITIQWIDKRDVNNAEVAPHTCVFNLHDNFTCDSLNLKYSFDKFAIILPVCLISGKP